MSFPEIKRAERIDYDSEDGLNHCFGVMDIYEERESLAAWANELADRLECLDGFVAGTGNVQELGKIVDELREQAKAYKEGF
jgi:hypothetical protein